MTKEQIKGFVANWTPDIFAGITYGGLVSTFKYFLQHFIDLGWVAAATLVGMLTNHYGRKYFIPWFESLPSKIKKYFKRGNV